MEIEGLLQHSDFLEHLVGHLVDDDASADDLRQEVWVARLERPPTSIRSWPAWVTRVARNLASNRRRAEARRAKNEARGPVPSRPFTPAETLQREELRRRVVEAVFALDEPYLSTVLHRFYDDLTPSEIAQAHGISVDTVKSRLRRGLDRLRTDLDREFGSRQIWLQVFVPLVCGSASVSVAGASAKLSTGGVALGIKKAAVVVAILVACAWLIVHEASDSSSKEMGEEVARIEGSSPRDSGSRSPTLPGSIAEEVPSPGPGVSTAAARGEANFLSEAASGDGASSKSDVAEDGLAGVGTVVYPDGEPASGVVVVAYVSRALAGSRFLEEVTSATTNANGVFDLVGVPEGVLTLKVGFENDLRRPTIEVPSIDQLVDPIVIDRTHDVYLAVEIAGAEAPDVLHCSLGLPNGGTAKREVTLRDPVISGAAPGVYELLVMTSGFPMVCCRFVVGDRDVRVPVRLAAASPHVIQVVDADGGRVPSASVEVRKSLASTGIVLDQLVTDESGCTEALLQPGLTIEVSAPGRASAFVEVTAEKIVSGVLEVELPSTGGLFVEVVDASGRPLDGIRVDYRCTTRGAPTALLMGTFAGKLAAPLTEGGRAQITGLPAGSYNLRFRHGDRDLGSLDVTLVGESCQVSFTVPDELSIQGIVRLDGQRLTGGVIHCGRAQADVAEDGSFTLTLSQLGEQTIVYLPSPDDRSRHLSATYEVVAHEPLLVDFRTATLRATIVGPDGRPRPQVAGSLRGSTQVKFVTDQRGRIVIDDLIEGEYRWDIDPCPNLYGPDQPILVSGDTVAEYQLIEAREVEIAVDQPEAQRGWVIRLQGLDADGSRCSIPRLGNGHYLIPVNSRYVRASTSSSAPVVIELSPDRIQGYEAALLRPGGNLLIIGRGSELIRIDPLGSTALHDLQRSVRLTGSHAAEPLPVGRYRLTPGGDTDRAIEVEVTEGGRTRAELR
ncbi:MAG: sigma-70 family RNA polymerase sigma factor [Planctomycetota bacterium]